MIVLRPLALNDDLTLVDRWMQAPHVAPWWAVTDTGAYLRGLRHEQPWIAEHDGRPIGYVETYAVADDQLGSYYDAQPGDRGWHVLVGATDVLGTPATRELGRTVVDTLLGEGDRAVCEPDVRNARMLAWCERIGGRRLATLTLPGKQAALFAWEATG